MKTTALLCLVSIVTLSACGMEVSSTSQAQTSLMPVSAYLAGKSYSRTIVGGALGQPADSVFVHRVNFLSANTVLDNANAAFGNPPRSATFTVENMEVKILEDGAFITTYKISKDFKTLTNSVGAVLTLDAAL